MNRSRYPKICIVSLYSYPLFNPDCFSPFGGSEVRSSLIAKELAKRGNFDVNLIVFDHGQPHTESRHGVTIYSWPGRRCPLLVEPAQQRPPQAGPPQAANTMWRRIQRVKPFFPNPNWRIGRLFFRSYRLLRRILRITIGMLYRSARFLAIIWRRAFAVGVIGPHIVDPDKVAIYRELDADVYLTTGNNEVAAELALYCKKYDKFYVMMSGSDLDFDAGILENPQQTNNYGVPAYLMKYVIDNASTFVVQHEGQANLLRDKFHRQAVVIRNPIDLTVTFNRSTEPETILWIGKSDSVKRPEIVIELAGQLTDYSFEIILNLSNYEIHKHCLEQAGQLPNVTIYSYVPFSEVERYFVSAKLLLNTSIFEGFPNTFLQAAKYGVPIVCLELDPGDMLSKYNCGYVCGGDLGQMSRDIITLMNMPSKYKEKSDSCLKYVRQFHAKEQIIDQYARMLTSLAELEAKS